MFSLTYVELFFLTDKSIVLIHSSVQTMNLSVESLSRTPRKGKLGWYDQSSSK